MRDARAVMHVGIDNPRRRGKRSRHLQPAILRIWQEAHGLALFVKLSASGINHLKVNTSDRIALKAGCINPLKPGAACMHQQIGSSLANVMACKVWYFINPIQPRGEMYAWKHWDIIGLDNSSQPFLYEQ